jgi:hypothetical protein
MIPRVAKKGRSFIGAGLYYLHDKGALTSDRVIYYETVNLPTENAQTAIKIMAYTAMHQAEIKEASGAAKTGRKLTQSVYSYSLSWAPDETPGLEEMREAAHETLQLLELEGHEAILIAHNDTAHPHIHVIVNRVHPETGIAAKLSCDQLTLSKWAEEYEKWQGKIRAPERVENNKKRRQRKARGENAFVKHKKDNTAANHAAQKARLKKDYDSRQGSDHTLDFSPPSPADHRRSLYQEKEALITFRKTQIRQTHRPQWAALYKQQKIEKQELNDAQRSAYSRLRYYLKQRRQDAKPAKGFRAVFQAALRAVTSRDNPHGDLSRRHEAQRKALSQEVKTKTFAAIAEENRAHRLRLDDLKKIQAPARQIRRDEQQREPKTVSEEFKNRARKRHRKRKKRDDRGKGFDRERD